MTHTRQELEAALDQGRLFWDRGPGKNNWRLRRNGATKTWKSDPSRFYIPVKAGLETCGAIEPGTIHLFVIQ